MRVETENGKTLELKTTDLAKLPRREVKARDHDGKETIYEGVDLREVLQLAGIKFNKESERLNLTRYLLIEAADKYRVVFAFAEIDTAFTDKVILLAEKSDGKLLPEKNGHWQIIVPDEKKHGRWLRQVIKLAVRTADSKITSSIETKLNDEDSIREIVFKEILKHWIPKSDKNLKAYYLSVDNKDPSENLLKKFTDYKVSIKKVSELTISLEDGNSSLDEALKKQGVLFSISKLDWKNKDEVKTNAGSYLGNMGSDGCLYTLKRENGEWKIISAENCFVS